MGYDAGVCVVLADAAIEWGSRNTKHGTWGDVFFYRDLDLRFTIEF